MRNLIVLLIALCTLAVELASAQDRPYVAIFKSPSSGFTAGVKYPGSKELGGAVMVHEDGTLVENGQTLYRFRSYDDSELVFYTPVPPGGGNNMKKPDGAAEAIGNGIVYLLTANAPVTRIERGGTRVSTADYVEATGGPRASGNAPPQSGEGPNTVTVAVQTFKKKKAEVQSKEDVVTFSKDDLDAAGKLKQDVYLKVRDRLMVVEVNNHHEITSFWFIRGGSRDRDAIFYRYGFRGTNVFATFDPAELFGGQIIALTASNLTAEQLDFVRANWLKRQWIKANQLVGRTPAPPAANRGTNGEGTSLLGVR